MAPSAASASPSETRLTVLGGAGAFFRGFGFLVTHPRTWPLALVPVVAAMLLTIAFAMLGMWGARAAIEALGPPSGDVGAAALWLARAVLYVIAIVTAVFLSLALAQPLSGPALDGIVRAQERELGGREHADGSFLESVGRSLRVTFVTLAIGAPILIALSLVELFWPPVAIVTFPLKLCISALLATWNLVDYPFALRGAGVRARWAWFKANLGACFGFGLVLATIALVPLLGFLVLPVGVAGATRLVVTSDPQPRRLPGR